MHERVLKRYFKDMRNVFPQKHGLFMLREGENHTSDVTSAGARQVASNLCNLSPLLSLTAEEAFSFYSYQMHHLCFKDETFNWSCMDFYLIQSAKWTVH